jgi:rhomboid protease GluP
MNFTNTVILQIIIFYCLVIAFQKSPTVKSVRLCAIGLPIIMGWCWYFLPKYAVLIGLGLWLPLILLPIFLMRHLNALLAVAQFDRARRLVMGLRWLIPTDGMWVYPQILRGMTLWQQNEQPAAAELLNRYRNDQRLMPRSAIALSYRSTNRWDEYLAWVDSHMNSTELARDRSPLRTYYLRALGETGNLSKLLVLLDRSPHPTDIMLLRLQTLAFCGRIAAVEKLCPVVLRSSPMPVQDFWLGTARLAAGQGAGQLQGLQSIDNYYLQQDLKWRLNHPLPSLSSLNADDLAMIDRLEVAALQEIDHGQQIPAQAVTPATNILVWLNIAVFGAEAAWKFFTQGEQLPWIAWGGVIAPLVMVGEWWRLVSANFLHFNFIHLLMNMLGLIYLGKFVEHRLGTWRFSLAYLLTGMGAMACVTYADLLKAAEIPAVTAGASGAIMGLLGVMGAIYVVSWWRHQTTTASRELKSIGLSVGLQFLFDITNGHTSIVGHFSGLAIGLVVGLLLASTKPK